MALKSGGRKLSFDILTTTTSFDNDHNDFYYRSKSDMYNGNGTDNKSPKSPKPRRRKRKSKARRKSSNDDDCTTTISDNLFDCKRYNNSNNNSVVQTVLCEEGVSVPKNDSFVSTVSSVSGTCSGTEYFSGGELRQRSSVVSGGEEEEKKKSNDGGDVKGCDNSVAGKQMNGRKLETEESLDWKRVMADDPNYNLHIEKSPLKIFIEEMYNGNSLRNTTTAANEKERERVYDTIFRLPWRCELLINVGFFVCLDSFLSLVTIMPTRLAIYFWRLLKARQFRRPSAAELSDFGCFVALACGVFLLQQTDISLIYHMIRGQGTIKLYVVYNVLEIFDKLCQSFGGDVLETLFNSADGLANCSPETLSYWQWRFISDEALAVASSIVHSFILLAQAITLSTCIVAHNNALPALLVSNNFAEIKSNVFKRFSKDNVQSMVYYDSIERFHISAFILFILAQNILEAEYPWFENFLFNASMVYICEMMIDIIKHSFIAKFNDLKPIVFSEFLEDLCRQRLNLQTVNGKKNLTFVPLAPACVVIRVLSPVYAVHLPHGPVLWRLLWIFLLSAMTFVMLTSLKVMIGMALQKHATWYVNRCQRRKLHSD